MPVVEHLVSVAPEIRLWVEERGEGTPLLLLMGRTPAGSRGRSRSWTRSRRDTG